MEIPRNAVLQNADDKRLDLYSYRIKRVADTDEAVRIDPIDSYAESYRVSSEIQRILVDDFFPPISSVTAPGNTGRVLIRLSELSAKGYDSYGT